MRASDEPVPATPLPASKVKAPPWDNNPRPPLTTALPPMGPAPALNDSVPPVPLPPTTSPAVKKMLAPEVTPVPPDTITFPPELDAALPVDNIRLPDADPVESPVDTIASPVRSIADAEDTTTFPLLPPDEVLVPDSSRTFPPLAVVAAPPLMFTSPPPIPRPAHTDTSPPCFPAEAPTFRVMSPEWSARESPDSIEIAPLAAVDDSPVLMDTIPVPNSEFSEAKEISPPPRLDTTTDPSPAPLTVTRPPEAPASSAM